MTSLDVRELDSLFDEAMRDPRTMRGLAVEETCRVLSELTRSRAPKSEYCSTMRELEQRYLEGFINTAVAQPGLVARIRKAINFYI